MKKIFFLLSLTIFPNITVGQEICTTETYKKIATANTWDNLRNNKGSLKFETGIILKKGLQEINDNRLRLSSIPSSFESNSSDIGYCQNKLSDTKKNPLKYSPPPFTSIEDLNTWVSDFSRGSGSEGEDLYAKCDKSCSPQYLYEISKTKNDLIELEAIVTCGLPRNKEENKYILTASCK